MPLKDLITRKQMSERPANHVTSIGVDEFCVGLKLRQGFAVDPHAAGQRLSRWLGLDLRLLLNSWHNSDV